MVAFAQPQDPSQDPDAIKKALLAKLFGGGPIPAPGTAPGVAQPTSLTPTAPATTAPAATQPNASAPPATPITAQPGPQPAKPMSTTPPVQPGDQVKPFPTEDVYNQQNPLPAHTPYQAPDLKHRILMGIFAGMQQFGKNPGAAERMLSQYGSEIQKNEDAESNYPATAAAQQHQKYMTAAQGAKAPLDLEDLKSQIADRQSQARLRNVQADVAGQPKPEKSLQQMHAEAMQDALARGVDPSTDPKVKQVEDAIQRIQKEPAAKTPNAKEGIQQQIAAELAKPQPDQHLVKNLQQRLKDIDPLAEDRLRDAESNAAKKESPADKHSASELAQVERETRVAIRKADSDYRSARSTADLQREFLKEAKGGNKEAVKMVPLEGALEITTSQGVHRINKTEVEQYGEAGGIWDRIKAKIGKGVSGKDIPDSVLDDMDKMTQAVIENAHKKYSDTYDDEAGIANGYGLDLSKKIPKLSKEGHSGGNAAPVGGAGALPPGWK